MTMKLSAIVATVIRKKTVRQTICIYVQVLTASIYVQISTSIPLYQLTYNFIKCEMEII